MNLFDTIRGWLSSFFRNRVESEFDVKPLDSDLTDAITHKCIAAYTGKPVWVDAEDAIKTINFTQAICQETARLTTLAIGITIDKGPNAKHMQDIIDEKVYYRLRQWIEYACAWGTVILKPNGEGIDFFDPDNFMVTNTREGKIEGATFMTQEPSPDGKHWYTRVEFHRFEDDVYKISNRTYVSEKKDYEGSPIPIDQTPWGGIEEEVEVRGLEHPLFAVLSMPSSNNVELNSPLSLPLVASALQELRDLDVAYSRHMEEIEDSRKIVLLDSDRLMQPGQKISAADSNYYKNRVKKLKLPRFVRAIQGDGNNTFYQEIQPGMNTAIRLQAIDALLSQIGYKIGFSNGYFVFDQKTGLATATQVEADQQRTIQFIKDIRDRLEDCMDQLIYAMEVMDSQGMSNPGDFEVIYDFGDITYSEEEDRARWYSYVMANHVPMWYFLQKFEGMSEEEAKQLVEEAAPKEPEFPMPAEE